MQVEGPANTLMAGYKGRDATVDWAVVVTTALKIAIALTSRNIVEQIGRAHV